MILVDTVAELRHWIGRWRRDDLSVGFVPTMGNLHRGHLELVRRARELAERVVVSIFVNPLQFRQGEDFDRYPRTLERDSAMLDAGGAQLLFAPSVAEMYPRPAEQQTRVEVPGLSDILCGASRPGHFAGVATVVCKLFNMVQPDLALFGEKDFQQLLVLRRMVEDLSLPIELVGVPTVREGDGLALSSRNGYLSEKERSRAPALYRALQETAAALRSGRRDFARLEQEGGNRLGETGLTTDYLSIRRAMDLAPPEGSDRDLVVLAAAFVGRTRLIDNLRVGLSDT
jgi:pantoate--beta-alanine ligase